MVKTCSKCNLTKSYNLFQNRKKSLDGKNTQCITCVQIYRKKYNKLNKPSIDYYAKEYNINNKDLINLRFKNKRKTNPIFKLTGNIRNSIKNSLHKYISRNLYKSKRTEEILCCSFEEFKQHIESLWKPWMNWDNYGLYNGTFNFGWDLDHIIPLSSAKTEEEIYILNHYTNIQPLCSYTNRDIKRDSIK